MSWSVRIAQVEAGGVECIPVETAISALRAALQ